MEIKKVEGEINIAATQNSNVSEKILTITASSEEHKQLWIRERDYLIKKEEQLRKKEEQLRKEKEQLRVKEEILRKDKSFMKNDESTTGLHIII